jgi:hypothetical protein
MNENESGFGDEDPADAVDAVDEADDGDDRAC